LIATKISADVFYVTDLKNDLKPLTPFVGWVIFIYKSFHRKYGSIKRKKSQQRKHKYNSNNFCNNYPQFGKDMTRTLKGWVFMKYRVCLSYDNVRNP